MSGVKRGQTDIDSHIGNLQIHEKSPYTVILLNDKVLTRCRRSIDNIWPFSFVLTKFITKLKHQTWTSLLVNILWSSWTLLFFRLILRFVSGHATERCDHVANDEGLRAYKIKIIHNKKRGRRHTFGPNRHPLLRWPSAGAWEVWLRREHAAQNTHTTKSTNVIQPAFPMIWMPHN